MGAKPCSCASKYNPPKSYETFPSYGKRNVLVEKKVSRISTISQHLPVLKLKTLMQQSDRHQLNDVYCERPSSQLSHELVNEESSASPTTLLQKPKSDKQCSSTNVLFLLIDLESQLDSTSKAMLHILKSYMGSQLMIVQDVKQIEKNQSNEKPRIFLFISAKYADSLQKSLNLVEKVFILGTSSNSAYKTSEDIQDLIFQIAEEFAQLYKEVPEQCKRMDESTLGDDKHQTICEMYRQLMDVPTGSQMSDF